MPAKSLGTLAMIYAIGELQNPLPRKTMLCKGDMNISVEVNTVVENQVEVRHFYKGRGFG